MSKFYITLDDPKDKANWENWDHLENKELYFDTEQNKFYIASPSEIRDCTKQILNFIRERVV